jgi:hypothetical protein
MKKKIIETLISLVTAFAILVPSAPANAQVVYTRKCCDASGSVRCILVDWMPVGNSCYCFQQGYGYAC